MEDNIDKEKIPTNIKSDNFKNAGEGIKESLTEKSNPEKENMEVHHHAHHGHEKKTWKNYVWEFLMLFLAVFCGFLAEWQLEHVIEHSREKVFIESIVKELESDNQQIDVVLKDTVRNNKLDSLGYALADIDNDKNNIKLAYSLKRVAGYFSSVMLSRSTISQLKNGGNMRLIRNRNVVDSIIVIDNYIDLILSQDKAHSDFITSTTEFSSKIFDCRYNLKYMKYEKTFNMLTFKRFLQQQKSIQYLNNDEKLRIEYANLIFRQKSIYDTYIIMIKEYQSFSKRMIVFFNQEYHLK